MVFKYLLWLLVCQVFRSRKSSSKSSIQFRVPLTCDCPTSLINPSKLQIFLTKLFQQLQDENLDIARRIDLACLLREFCNFSNTLQVTTYLSTGPFGCYYHSFTWGMKIYSCLHQILIGNRRNARKSPCNIANFCAIKVQGRTSFLRSLANKRLFPTLEFLLAIDVEEIWSVAADILSFATDTNPSLVRDFMVQVCLHKAVCYLCFS